MQRANWQKPSSRPKTISVADAAEKIGVSKQTVRSWLKKGEIDFFQPTTRGKIMIVVESLERELKTNGFFT